MSKKPAFDYSKLAGKIKEQILKGNTSMAKLADVLNVSTERLSTKVNNANGNNYFSQPQITACIQALDISPNEIPVYFYTLKVLEIESEPIAS